MSKFIHFVGCCRKVVLRVVMRVVMRVCGLCIRGLCSIVGLFASALIKARAALEYTGYPSIADDSGLVVDALDGAPGIYSARYAGEHGNDEANNNKLFSELALTADDERRAHFHSSVVLVYPDGRTLTGNGDCTGRIGFAPRGSNGFGYDPLFVPDAMGGRTMAELTPDEKNSISHRFYALQDLATQIAAL